METRFNRLFAAMLAVGLAPAVSAFDPLYSEQWHLDNTGQTAFAANPAVAGNDLNTKLTQAMGIAGIGVKVAVIDSGVQIDHPDLAGNVVTGSRNFVEDSLFPSSYPVDTNGHGTAVAGLISAVGNNGEGGRGVASRSSLVGFNWLANQTLEGWLISHGMDPATRDVRVFNQSYGFSPINQSRLMRMTHSSSLKWMSCRTSAKRTLGAAVHCLSSLRVMVTAISTLDDSSFFLAISSREAETKVYRCTTPHNLTTTLATSTLSPARYAQMAPEQVTLLLALTCGLPRQQENTGKTSLRWSQLT